MKEGARISMTLPPAATGEGQAVANA
jgi:hypothetical protein